MNTAINDGLKTNSEAFSVATLIYARLRRVLGRVVDVVYLVENKEYACYVAELAQSTEDTELQRHAARLQVLLELEQQSGALEDQTQQQPDYSTEVTEEEIYRAQVPHHYIGALR
ncbi:hypothetical protein [Acinetobacter sp. WZC-1]|uniref:hypothetical protein n=1 Tax=Acinetobacter sp. WZC-1 TaxID=3459034 RepID=UPI00403DBED0